ncbi:unnamed protein product, partial [Prorocentrum cordatum]
VVATQIQAHTANITTQVHSAVVATMQEAQGTIIEQLQSHFAPATQRVDGHDLAIGDSQRRQFNMEDAQREMRADTSRINNRLALAEEDRSSVDTARLADFDRDPYPTIFTVNAPDDVGPAEVRGAVAPWLTDAKIETDGTVVHARGPSRRFILEVKGGTTGVSKAIALAKALRFTSGDWRRFSATHLSGASGPLHMGPDKAPKQIRREQQSKRLAAIAQEHMPNKRWWATRARGLVHIKGQPLVEVAVRGGNEASRLAWNQAVVAQHSVDVASITAAFNRACTTLDTSSWSWS